MRKIIMQAEENDPLSLLALEMYTHRIKKYIGAYTVLLGRVDAVIFTGGIGENSAVVRRNICDGLDVIGVAIDTAKNAETVGKEGDISTAQSKVRVWVVPTNEEMAIAKDTYKLVTDIENEK